MSEFKGTPGPYEVHVSLHHAGEFWASIGANGWGPLVDVVGAEGNKAQYYIPVAGMKYLVTPVEEQKANAQLFAASWDLLQALKSLVDNMDYLDWSSHPEGLEAQARAAIAKALGQPEATATTGDRA